MSVLSSITRLGPAAGSARASGWGLGRLGTTLAAEWRAFSAARTLRSFDDHVLRDMGVSRSEIDHAVRFGRD